MQTALTHTPLQALPECLYIYVTFKTSGRAQLRGPQGEALGILDTLFWYTSTWAQQQMLHLPSMVRPPYQEGPGQTFAIHFSWIHASWSSSWR